MQSHEDMIKLLPNDPEELKKIILKKDSIITNLQFDIFKLNETIKIYQHKLFGRKTEKLPQEEQPGLFNESEVQESEITNHSPQEKIKITYERLKKSGKRTLPSDLPRIEKHLDLSPEEKSKLEAEGTLTKIGEEISEKLEIIPQQVYVLKIIRAKYSFKKNDCESKIITAAMDAQIIPQGIATPSALAYVFKTKFVDAMPYYRQEKMFASLGIDLNRNTMCNWQINVYYNYLIRLVDLMKRDLRACSYVGADETTLQVIKEEGKPPDSKSYMWVYRGMGENKVILLYDYQSNRCGQNPKDYLEGFQGYLQTDGYDGYNLTVRSSNIIHLACWAHVRRKFFNCFKVLDKDKYPESKIILDMIKELYAVEKKIKLEKMTNDAIYQFRQKEAKPVLEKIKEWLDTNVWLYPPSCDMGEAINYTLKLWPQLTVYVNDGRLLIDNNLVENAIRPFVIGRKNWLFAQNADGAESSAALYSLIETAKANHKDPYKVLIELFEKLPLAKTDADYEKLLPY